MVVCTNQHGASLHNTYECCNHATTKPVEFFVRIAATKPCRYAMPARIKMNRTDNEGFLQTGIL